MKPCAIALGAAAACATAFGAPGVETKPSANLERRGKEFVSLLAAGKFAAAAATFDATMTKAMGPAKLKQVWEGLTGQVGALRGQAGVRTEKAGAFTAVLVTCEFAKARLDVKIVYDRAGKVSGLWFLPATAPATDPPPYCHADRFEETDVTVSPGPLALPGTLSMPKAAEKVPAVVLVHGSGSLDRDDTVGACKPFRDLACGLASRGVAVLRYEKRPRQHPEAFGAGKKFTVWEETVQDALAAVTLLRENPRVDSGRVFVLGHSLGGMLVPRIAARDKRIAGFIVLAGAARPIEDLILEQFEYIYRLDGRMDADEARKLAALKAQIARVKAPKLSADTPGYILGASASYWLDLRDYRPADAARLVARPMLIAQGGRDYQVTMKDFALWKAALAGRKDVTFKAYPKLNHLFVPGVGKSSPAEYAKGGYVAELVITDIVEWIGGPSTAPSR